MTLLLDAHAMLWFFWADPRLSNRAKQLIEDPADRKLVSLASCWEISVKVSVGKLKLGEPTYSFLHREITRNNFELLPISLEHAASVDTLPLHHRDPFDRLLIAQALIDKVAVVSVDPCFDQYGVTRLW
jgi:PIN domain nuclease of toxin-antitoxin system